MSTLFEIQEAFQSRLLRGEGEIAGHLAAGGRFMGVYDHAYTARLLEVLGEDFPALHTLLGDEAFAEAMRAYLTDTPSNRPSIRWLGRELAKWLGRTSPWDGHGVLANMAAFEWAAGLAFDAPDAPVVTVQTLADLSPDAWPQLIFTFHPALSTAFLTWDVVPFRQAVVEERDPDGAPEPYGAPQAWAVWRHPETLITHYRPLADDEAQALACARDGGDFSHVCEVLAAAGDADTAASRAAGLLRVWVESGWVSAVGIAGGSL